jgi:hypothetical protein
MVNININILIHTRNTREFCPNPTYVVSEKIE